MFLNDTIQQTLLPLETIRESSCLAVKCTCWGSLPQSGLLIDTVSMWAARNRFLVMILSRK